MEGDVSERDSANGTMDEDSSRRNNVSGETNTEDNVSRVTTFEELMVLVGSGGRWNLTLFTLCALSAFVTPWSAMTYQFLGITPDYWCHVAPLVAANWTTQQILALAIPKNNDTGQVNGCFIRNYNYTAAVELGFDKSLANESAIALPNADILSCTSHQFNLSQYDSTIVTEWDLVCDRRPLYSTTQAASQLGTLFGSIIYGYMLDMIGRRKSVLTSAVLSLIVSFLTVASPNVETYIFMRALLQVVDFGCYTGCLLVTMELCTPRQRNYVASFFLLPWAVGYMMVPGVAYLVRPWRWMLVAFTIPVFYYLIYFWMLPESPRWLILHSQYEEAIKILHWAAKVNRKTLPSDEILITALKNIRMKEKPSKDDQESTAEVTSPGQWVVAVLKYIFILVTDAKVRIRALVVIYLWFATGMIYYGVSHNAENLSADIYIYFFLSGLFEVPAYLFLLPAITTLGRRKTLTLLFLACGVSICLVVALMIMQQELVGVKIFLSLMGKMAITAAFQLIWVYTMEVFSTKHRSRALGAASMFCRIGSMCSPYINDIMGEVVVWGPSALFSSVALMGASLVYILPETTNNIMPHH
nr:organic cation transporter-like protein [Procambarus clarkii]